MKEHWVIAVLAILILGTLGSLQYANAESVIIGQGTTVTVESGTTMTVESTDVPNTVTNLGTLNVENTGKLAIQDEGAFLNDCTGTTNLASGGEVDIGSPGSTLSTLTNHGQLNGPGQINFLGITIDVKNSGILTAVLNPLTTIQQIIDPCAAVGGTMIPLDTTALFVSSAQTSLFWLFPAVAILGASVVLYKKRRQLNE